MADHGWFNFYTQFEYEPYQQYQQFPSEDERITNVENTLNIFMQQSMINMQETNQRLKNLSSQLEMIQAQIMENQANIQSTHGEQENNSNMFEKVGEIVREGVVETEEDIMLEGCGTMKIMKEIVPPREKEVPQERSCNEEAKTVDNGEVMMVTEKQERLLSKEELMETRGKKVNKVEIDRVIDEICALFSKHDLGSVWTPHQLYFKFMEFLPKRRNTKDDVLSVSFWPP
jgi:hypothetical protein